MIYSPEGESKRPAGRTRGRRPRTSGKPKQEEEKETKEEEKDDEDDKEEEEKPSLPIPNPLMWFYEFFNSWKKVQMNYTHDTNVNNAYVSAVPDLGYQFGFTKDPGVLQDTSQTNGLFIGPSITNQRSLRTSLSFDIIKNVKIINYGIFS